MSNAKWVDFKEIKNQVNIESVLEHYGLLEKLKRKGDNLVGPCPIHQGSNPTQFHVSLSKNNYNCFGNCHGGGNIIDFVCAMEGLSRENPEDFRKAALLIQEWFSLDTHADHHQGAEAGRPVSNASLPQGEDRSLPSELAREKEEGAKEASAQKESAKRKPPKKKGVEDASPPSGKSEVSNPPLRFFLKNLDQNHSYLSGRGLTEETIEVFGLGLCSKGMMAGRIAIPIQNDAGELVAYVGRWPCGEDEEPPEGEPKYKLPGGFHKSLVLFNFHRAREFIQDLGWVILVEGLFDCMRVWQAGFKNVVALLGSQLSEEQERLILEAVGPGGRVALMFDEDASGWACRDEVLDRMCSRVYVKIIRLGEEGMQPDKLTEESIRELLT